MTRDRTAGWSRTRRVVVGGLIVAVLWLLAAVVMVVLGLRAADRGADELDAVEDRIGLADLFADDTTLLEPATAEFESADRWLSNPLVRPLRFVPVGGRQLRSAAGVVGTSADLLHAGQDTIEAVSATVERGVGTGEDRLALLDTLRDELDDLSTVVEATDLGPRDALVGPLRRARAEAAGRIGDVREGIADARAVLDAAEDVLSGPTSYLVLASNNAEMRVGSGTFLSVGRVEFDGGRIAVGEFEPAVDLQLDDPVPLPAEVEQLWGWAGPGREWRSLGFTPRFPVNAALAVTMWEARGGEPVDGVLALDVVGLEHLLRATGPVMAGGESVDADAAVPLLLHDQYAGVESSDDNAARRERLSQVASAVVDRLGAGDVDAQALVEGLRSAQRGRHLMLWSPDPDHQRAWGVAGATGELDARSLLVGVANVGGNKLDPFVDVEVDASSDAVADGRVRVTLVVRVENRTPGGEPAYVLGGDPSGIYEGVVVAYLPGGAADLEVDGGDVVASGPDGESDVVGIGVDVERFDRQRITISFSVPQALAADIELVPSARVPPVGWQIDGRYRSDARRANVAFGPGR